MCFAIVCMCVWVFLKLLSVRQVFLIEGDVFSNSQIRNHA